MPEIKTELRHVAPGETFTADGDGAYVIEDRHTINDILRFMIGQGWRDEITFFLSEV